ncbi:PilW family protein [Rhodoferax antarcticus]|uniref:PilW family protein n=1 Tax=Rhodoferax antarcticus TaxID=81479 RepID=UPI0022252829|nr:PilW family protein [Rhodoferax antarcticus]MCW2314229.1 type IV pilus assembly protein PilW [Rhodoferax antarcticus]
MLNVVVANRETYRATENLTRIQENARTGFDFMARDLREAGQNPCGTPLVANVIRKAGAIPWWADWNKGTIIGVDGGQDRTDIEAFGTTKHARVAGTDAVIVIRAEQNEKTIKDHDTASTLITLTSTSSIKEKDIVMACDLTSAAIFQVYDESSSGKVIDHQTDATVLNCSNLLGHPTTADCLTPAPPPLKKFKDETSLPAGYLSKLVASFWYVGYAANGQRSLYRTRIKNDVIEPEEMVPGVQDLQLEYLTSTGGTLATDWVTASDGTTFPGATATVTGNWQTDQANKAVAVRLNMTLQSEEKVGTNQQAIQRQLIHVVTLRSRDYLF